MLLFNYLQMIRRAEMNNKKITDFAMILSRYFFEYLPIQKGVSDNTIRSYRDTISLFLNYCETIRKLNREKLKLDDLNKELVCGFYAWLEDEKKCSVSTRNQRRAGINSFFKFIQYEKPEYILLSQQVLSIPLKRCEPRLIEHISIEAIQKIFEQPDLSTGSGRRDFAFLSLMYESAARASEIASLRIGDVYFDRNGAIVHLRGKGNKCRDIPLISNPSDVLKNYLKEEARHRRCDRNSPLFCNKSKAALTRGGVYFIIRKYVTMASQKYPELFPNRVHPHVFRHSRAMHWLEAGVDLQYIKDLLGHSDIATTEIYVKLSIELKRKMLEAVHPQFSESSVPSWTEDNDLMSWLNDLRLDEG